jgi:DNA-binding NarL/FixJ family response regulator
MTVVGPWSPRFVESKPRMSNKNPRTIALSSLTSKQASVIELADRGLPETEIAEQLGAPVDVVRARSAM